MIPKEKIEEVRERASIVAVVSDYVPLRKRGSNYVGLCPFHSEKTPSFSVNEEKKIFYCFGCNAAGNAITFLMKKDGAAFPDAVRALAERFGVTITEEKKGSTAARDSLYEANRLAAEYFSVSLRADIGRSARDYLKKRGFAHGDGIETVRRFSVGFAPDKWDGLISYLSKKGIAPDTAEKAGVAVKKEKGCYDRFRGRVIFPVTDLKGRVVAFGGRSIDGKDPKYLNSPETALFKKGETLYGFYQAKGQIAKSASAIIVEGYFDLLSLHCHGFSNSVATMGTALTAGHLKALKGYAGTVYALFDSDEAGRGAALRGLDLFLNEELPCRVVLLKGAKDPDEFLLKSGAEAMKAALDAAEPLMEFYLKELRRKIDINTPEGKGRYLDSAVPYIAKVKNSAEKGHYAAAAAAYLGVRAESVYEALKAPSAGALRTKAARGAISVKGANAEEVAVIKVLLKHPELYSPAVDDALALFKDPALKDAGEAIIEYCRRGRLLDPSAVIDEIRDEGARAMVAGTLLKEDDGFIEAPEKMLRDCLKKVLNRGKLKPETEEMIKRLEASGRQDVADKMRERTLKRPLK